MDATFLPGNEENNSNKNSSNTALCRQTTTRWTPTTEQIRILKDLYYNTGIRSPSAEQIQKISAKLRHYGKIEGKNVFYWFQNHKARERQKKRLITNTATHDHRPTSASASVLWRSEDHAAFYNKCPNFTSPAAAPGAPSGSTFSPGGMIHADGQFGKFANYGSFAHVENGFWGGGHGGGGGGGIHNLGWTTGGVDPYYHQYYTSSTYNFLDKNTLDEEQEQEEDEEESGGGGLMETLPLFPIHGEEVSGGFWKQESAGNENYNNSNNWYMQGDNGGGKGNMTCSRASLELTLNSYGCSNWSG